MHDIDSTRLEISSEQDQYQEHQDGEYASAGQAEDSLEMPMSEEEEEALAAELLGVSNEEEMDQFFGKLFRKLAPVIRGAGKFLSKNGGPLSGALKGIARKALPFIGGALGTAIPIPGLGTAIGSAVGQAAGNLLEAETDHLEVEEREFQMAKRFVRLASQAVRQGVRMPMRLNPMAVANLALRQTIQRLNRGAGFRYRPIYRPCPPCPPCPAYAPPFPTADALPSVAHGAMDTSGAGDVSAPSATGAANRDTSGEFQPEANYESGYAGEGEAETYETDNEALSAGEGEAESYETDNEAFAATPSNGRGGRWVRRGRKIILYGL